MNASEKRTSKRYDAFVPLTIYVPASWGAKEFEVNGWIKDVSKEGVALEICIMSSDEILPIREIVDNKQRVIVSIPIPDDFTRKDTKIDAECKIMWGTFSKKKKFYFYNMGVKILRINPLQKLIWNTFIENFSKPE